MTGRRAIVGLCMLCALAFSAFAAPSASAATKGTTAFTCKKKPVKGGAGFSKEHCRTVDAVSSEAEFEHKEITEETTTEITGGNTTTNNEKEVALLKSTQAGIAEELSANIVEKDPETSAWMKNRKDPTTGEHYIEGEGNLTYTEVFVTKPAGNECKVFGKAAEQTPNSITTERLLATTKGQGDAIKFTPAAGTVFAKFFIAGCKTAALNGEYKVEGSLVAEVDGATIRTLESNITTQGNLKLRGQKAGLEGVLTIRGTDTEAGDKEGEDTALSATTVETP